MELNVPLHVIGVVRTGHTELESTPIQAAINRAEHATVEIGDAYKDGLDGLAGFDYAWMLTWLHRSDDPANEPDMSRMPFLLREQGRRVGLFATRAPRRVNSIGLSLIQILRVGGSSVSFAGETIMLVSPSLSRVSSPVPNIGCKMRPLYWPELITSCSWENWVCGLLLASNTFMVACASLATAWAAASIGAS